MFAWFILLLLGAIWGASYMFIKVGVAEIPPFTFVTGRTLIASLALYIAMRLRGEALPTTRAVWTPILVMAIFNSVIPYTLITWGETSISSALAAILTATNPLFTVVLANFWTHDERFTRHKVIGILLGFFGVVILFLPAWRQGIQIEFWGMLAVVGAALCYAVSLLVARKRLGGMSHYVASTAQLGLATVMLIPLSLAFDNPFALRPSPLALGALALLALLGTSIAYILYYWLIENTGATRTSLVTYLIPITGIFWGALLLNETIQIESIIGLTLIIGGVGLVTRQSKPAANAAVVAEGK